MSKIIDSLVQASIDSKDFAGVMLCKLSFDSPTGDLRYSSAYQSIYWDESGGGEVEYEGLGGWAGISVLNESRELQAQTIQLTLSGIPNDALTNAFSTNYVGNPIYIWYATLDKETYAVEGGQGGPVLVFAGRMDYSTIEFGNTADIIMNATSRLADWDRARGGRFNHEYQVRHVDSTDDGFEYVKGLQNRSISWGGYTVLDPYTTGPGSSCFIADTKISMFDGSYKYIKDVKKGDLLKNYEGKAQEVLNTEVVKHQGDIYSVNDDNYFVTSSHPFKTIEGWKAFDATVSNIFNKDLKIKTLSKRDTLITETGTEVIKTINTTFFDKIDVYNIKVGGSSEYFANGYLVHNKREINEGRGGGYR